MLFHSPFVFLLLFFFFQNFVRFRVERNTLESRLQKKSRFYRNQRTFDNLIFDNTKKKHSPFHFELCDRLTTHRKYSWLHFVVSMIKNRNGVVFLQRFTGRNKKKRRCWFFFKFYVETPSNCCFKQSPSSKKLEFHNQRYHLKS